VASKPGPIPAGGKDKISVVVHTNNRGGQPLRKRFTVYTNDPRRSQIELIVTGKVMTFAEINPAYVRMIGYQGESLSTTVRILPRKEYPFVIKEVKVTGDRNIEAALHPLGPKPDRDGYQLVVTSKGNKLGSFRGSIVVHTDSKQKSTLKIPFNLRIRNRPSVETKSLNAE
jgi:hypothetical protein